MAHKRRPATGRQLDRAPAGGDSLGLVRFGSKSADYSRATIQRPWFAHYLHGKGDGPVTRTSRALRRSGLALLGRAPIGSSAVRQFTFVSSALGA
jgi:hypothetical protein